MANIKRVVLFLIFSIIIVAFILYQTKVPFKVVQMKSPGKYVVNDTIEIDLDLLKNQLEFYQINYTTDNDSIIYIDYFQWRNKDLMFSVSESYLRSYSRVKSE